MVRLHDASTSSTLIPPPTVSGILPRPLPETSSNVPVNDESAALERTQRSLERQLQHLLDAQSVGLSASRAAQGGESESGEHDEPILSLHSARHGILDTIRELSILKATELESCQSRSVHVHHLLKQISHWQDKKRRLDEEIQRFSSSGKQNEIDSLKGEDVMVQEQINAMEEKLSELRAYQENLRGRISQAQNSRACEISSYQSSLSMVNDEIENFMRRPLPDALQHAETTSVLRSLPPKRRTLDMIVNQLESILYSDSVVETKTRREYEALVNGGSVWQEALEAIENFEALVKRATRELTASAKSESDASDSASPTEPQPLDRGSATLFDGMRKILETLQELLKDAEDRGWTLMIAAVSVKTSLALLEDSITVCKACINCRNDCKVNCTNMDTDQSS